MTQIDEATTKAHKAVIKKFGGQAKVSRLLGVDRRVVWNWTRRGIPKSWRQVLVLRAGADNIKLPRGFANG